MVDLSVGTYIAIGSVAGGILSTLLNSAINWFRDRNERIFREKQADRQHNETMERIHAEYDRQQKIENSKRLESKLEEISDITYKLLKEAIILIKFFEMACDNNEEDSINAILGFSESHKNDFSILKSSGSIEAIMDEQYRVRSLCTIYFPDLWEFINNYMGAIMFLQNTLTKIFDEIEHYRMGYQEDFNLKQYSEDLQCAYNQIENDHVNLKTAITKKAKELELQSKSLQTNINECG